MILVLGRIDKAMNGLKVKLQTAYKASGGQKVNVISHSMGGLLVQCFMYLHKDVSPSQCISEINVFFCLGMVIAPILEF